MKSGACFPKTSTSDLVWSGVEMGGGCVKVKGEECCFKPPVGAEGGVKGVEGVERLGSL